ncbi:protein vestigial-like [Ctenocephalides felis]|uniref:protein vestigial-like n=1 Tax=Ctenocephalides felis TaxID=7515 RepID=UPI000E6E14DD|nr:protein vestigial-like [Ctenocephalides felis]
MLPQFNAQDLYGGSTSTASSSLALAAAAGSHSLAHSSGGSVGSGGGHSPCTASPLLQAPTATATRPTKEEDLSVGRRSAEGPSQESDCSSSPDSPVPGSSSSSGARAQYVSASCVVFTHYSGDAASSVDEHFSRALSFSEKNAKDISPMTSRNFPPSFWNSQYQPPPVTLAPASHGDLYAAAAAAEGYAAHHAAAAHHLQQPDPWTQHYTAAAQYHHHHHHHHQRASALHDYHQTMQQHHHMAGVQHAAVQYPGLLLPQRLPQQYGHSSRLHEQASTHAHALETAGYPGYPTMAGEFIKY